jgi:hypothetical protein
MSGQAAYASPVKGTVGGGFAQYATKSPISTRIQGTAMTPQSQRSPVTNTATPKSVTTPSGYASPNVGRALQLNMSPRGQALNASPSQIVCQQKALNASPSQIVAAPVKNTSRISSSPAPTPLRQQQYQRPINPMSSLASAPPDSKFLSEGEVTKVGGKEYVIISQLGQGAFGKVWLVRQQNSGAGENEFALKVTTSKEGDTNAQKGAVFEMQVLQHLTAHLSKDLKDAGRVPSYIGHHVSHQGKSSVACVMSRLYGGPLDVWLYGVDEEVHKTINPEFLISGPLVGGKMATMRLSGACNVALSVLAQLAPVLHTLQSFAFHRDISNHNILVRDVIKDPVVAKIDISLIDFGLATSTRTWYDDWRTSNICGDPRYWTPGAWLNLAFGWKYLSTHPNTGLVRQYKERLDHFSMGILGLEMFFALWNGIDDSGAGRQLEPVQMAWSNYWRLALETFQDFHRLEISMLRKKLTQCQTVNTLERKLQVLRTALLSFAQKVPNHACATLFTVCSDLLDEWGQMSWTALQHHVQKQPTPSDYRTIDVDVAVVEPKQNRTHRRVRTTAGSCDLSDVQEVGVNNQSLTQQSEFLRAARAFNQPSAAGHQKMASEATTTATRLSHPNRARNGPQLGGTWYGRDAQMSKPRIPTAPQIAQNRSYVPPVVNHSQPVVQTRSYVPAIDVQ